MYMHHEHELNKLAKDRDRAYKLYVNISDSNNSLELWNNYKNKRNKVTNLLKRKKIIYYEGKIDANRNNAREMWKCLKNLVKKSNVEIPFNCINFGDDAKLTAVSEYQGACMFNTYFINSIIMIADTIVPPNEWSCVGLPTLECEFGEFQPLDIGSLRQIVFGLKNCTSVSNVLNSKFLKETFDTLGYVILNFINTSLANGSFPSSLKTSTITPIQKVLNNIHVSNFRPINNLPCIEKVLEKAVHNQLVEYFNINNLFLGNQSGFRKGHSCETAIQLTVTKWKMLIDKGNYIVAIFLDLKRAFETIDRSILIKKLRYYGIKGKVLDWFSDYLVDRRQSVRLGQSSSSEIVNNLGVPQGSVLGALLFIIYLNDINFVEGLEFINLFADDTLIACSGKDVQQVIERVNRLLESIEVFFRVNKLKLNTDKTKAMILGSRFKVMNLNISNLKVNIDNNNVEWVSEIKYLGFIMDNLLSFKNHCQYIQKKISKKLFFFSRVAKNLSMFARITVFKTIIQPHFDYCATLTYMADKGHIQALQVLYNRGMRIILRCNRYTSISLMLSTLNWFSVGDRLYYFTMVFVFKLRNGMLPSYFTEFVTLRDEIHSYSTRRNMDFHINKTNYVSTMTSLFYRGMNGFNLLPVNVKNAVSLAEFKNKLKNFILGK